MSKPVLYIDVDGVLFGRYGEYPTQLRPNVVGFLLWCMEYFECRWMTAWPKDRLDLLFKMMYAPKLTDIPDGWSGGGDKDKRIDLAEDFYWIEDGEVRPRLAGLKDEHGFDRYIEVNTDGADELQYIRIKLFQRLRAKGIPALTEVKL